MKTALRILHLEDNRVDAELIHDTLAAEGISCEAVRVETRRDFVEAVERGGFDLILADYNLPAFDGISALAIVQEKCREVPFIFVTGSLGEEVAIETLKSGANDYVLKHRPGRLVPAVRRAIDEVAARKERTNLEDQLRHAQKMESIGTLAGGVAHDFNNLLTVILGNAQLALGLQPDSALQSHLLEIESSAKRAADLTRQLLIFGRRQKLEPQSIDLNDTIRSFMKLLRRIIGEDVEVDFREASDLPTVLSDPGHIEQIVMNLAVNARDAMPDGGKIVIETQCATLDEAYCREHSLAKPGMHALIIVSDTGAGMDAETQQRIFEPFFTTKEVGKGTGLGLAVVYGIVREHGGRIEVYSQLKSGTTLKVYLPAQRQMVGKAPGDNRPALRGGTETVLIAEDEEPLQRLAKNVLASLGYQVMVASDGLEAVEMYVANQEKIDLVVLDVVMPRMGGPEAYERICALGNGVPVIFMTGFSAEIAQNKFAERNIVIVQKPYSLDTLGRKVRDALDALAYA